MVPRLLAAIGLWLATTTGASAQSMTMAGVAGVLRSDTGDPVGTALVTLTPIGPGAGYETTSGPTGLFDFGLIRPGSYEVRVEALGYRPLIARILTVAGGDQRALDLSLTTDPPPVALVDTISLGTTAAARWRTGGMQFGGWEIDDLPHRFDDLSSVATLSTAFDEALGAQGLPGDMTVIVADGLPFFRAEHPVARSEDLPDALFPTSVMASVAPNHMATDIERAGSASGYVTLETLSSQVGGGFGVTGSLSGPGWTSSQLDLDNTPTLFGFQAGVQGGVVIDPARSQLTLSGEALRQQTPLAPRVDDALAPELAGLDPALLATLSDAGIETYDRYSGLIRFDARQGRDNQFFIRGSGALARRQYEGFGPASMAGTASLPQESVDFSIAGGVVNQQSSATQLEVRAGLSGSSRDFFEGVAGLPPAYLVDAGASLGGVPSSFGKSSRLDALAAATLRHQIARNETVKGGMRARFSSHTMTHSQFTLDDLLYADGGQLVTGVGYGRSTNALEQSFSSREYGGFAQYERTFDNDVTIIVGARYDYEFIPTDPPERNEIWFEATGIDNTAFPSSWSQFGASGSVTWNPGGTGDTRLFLTGSLQFGDMDSRAVYEVYATSTEARSERFEGSGLAWPTGGVPAATPDIVQVAMLGPDSRPPRSAIFSGGFLRRFGPQLSVFGRAGFRRTDFLLRRRNLNLLHDGSTFDPYGREVLGRFDKDGGMVTTTGQDARLFTPFGDAWALDPDGWSEQLAFTVGLEHTSQALEVYGAYTWSETIDNWVGAGSGTVGGTLGPGLPASDMEDWSEGTSDFDIPHRISAGATTRVGPVALGAAYRFRSGRPFTPRYRAGVDVNGDGSTRNDVAWVPSAGELADLLGDWSCLSDQADGFAVRNSCRGPSEHALDLRLEFMLGAFAGQQARITLDAFNLIESEGGVIDDALLLVDPDTGISSTPGRTVVTIPTTVNPGFGNVLYPTSRGRMLRIGMRLGG